MAANASKRHTKLRYFYLETVDGLRLHKALSIDRSHDKIVTWCYSRGERVVYTYSDVRRRKKPAYRHQEVAEFINRSAQTIQKAILRGDIEPPEFVYTLDEHRTKYMYLWSEEDIFRLHDYFLNRHMGPVRKDGGITPKRLPTLRELRAMVRQEDILYVKNEDGEFVPTWQAQNF